MSRYMVKIKKYQRRRADFSTRKSRSPTKEQNHIDVPVLKIQEDSGLLIFQVLRGKNLEPRI